jgi:hypothetical protein
MGGTILQWLDFETWEATHPNGGEYASPPAEWSGAAIISKKGNTEMRFLKPHASKLLGLLTFSLVAVSAGRAQSVPKDMISLPIETVSEKTIQLESKGGRLFSFALSPHTVYCQGDKKVWDWVYLKNKATKDDKTVTIKLSADSKTVLVIWDQRPAKETSTDTTASGSETFTFPPMCK